VFENRILGRTFVPKMEKIVRRVHKIACNSNVL
jgi:hypothetical protein